NTITMNMSVWFGCHKSSKHYNDEYVLYGSGVISLQYNITMNMCVYLFRWRRPASCGSRSFGYHWMVRQVQMNRYTHIFISISKSDL
ncbi:MAG: hypothetical protein ACYDEX_15200, partial [Mobilitalea sp.]